MRFAVQSRGDGADTSPVRRFVPVACSLALALGTTPVSAMPVRPLAPVPGSHCAVFPSDSIWNTRVDRLPVDPDSDTWLASMDASNTNLHPDFGPPDYGMPFDVVSERHRVVRVRFTYADESDRVRYPVDRRTPVEGGSDHHVLVVNKSTCALYELFAFDWNHGSPRAGSGAVWDLTSNALRPNGWTSADAAGLPILPGLVRYDEVADGSITHAIRFTAELTGDRHVWPARHDAGSNDASYPPMGARFRLRASFGLTGFSAKAKVILRAMKRYGLILADNGSNWYFQGARDDRWTNRLLDQLKTLPASAFEAVDTAGCLVDADSGQADCPA
jgi:hypothetical protein